MKWLIINPERLLLAIGPERQVFVQLQYPHDQTGLAPGVELAIQMTPAQAREIAKKLLRKADEAESSPS